ncbi:MAG: PfkB family carbohydrate kinase [Dysgonamonadaceae bacterium]|jgi:fructokinase|nr:PfkB family carbohydrate kinase [Dysgonamonadaceae bacterium]
MCTAIGTGEIILDIIFRNGRPYHATPGGSVFNGTVSLARSGIRTVFIGELCNDRTGRQALDFMHRNRIDVDYIEIYDDDGNTPVSLAYLDDNNDAQYTFYRNPPAIRRQFRYPPITKGDVVIIGSYFAVSPEFRDHIRRLLGIARLQGATVYYDINFRAPHAHQRKHLIPAVMENFMAADIVRGSMDDLDLLFPGETPQTVYGKYLNGKLFVVTDGGKDIYFRNDITEKYYTPPAIKTVSTIGAGDSFNAGIVLSILQNNITDAGKIGETDCDKLAGAGIMLASQVCMSMENYL